MNSSIADGRYGLATSEIQMLLHVAQRVSDALGAGRPAPATQINVQSLVCSHFDRLAAAGVEGMPATIGITLIAADALSADCSGGQSDPETAFGLQWAPYRKGIRLLRRRLNAEVTTDAARRALVVPPLWPFSGQPSIRSEPRIARDSNSPIPWFALCELENALGDALLWAVTRSDPHGNPFLSLLEIGALGMAPLGLRCDRFLICAPVADTALDSGVEAGDSA
jgi:hypothetical protein